MVRCLMLVLLSLLVVCVLAQIPRRPFKVPEVDQKCMECICLASSNCDESLRCHNSGGSAYFCGPYVISWGYWHDGGRPGDKGRSHDFETCLNNKTCAEKAVRGYMRKYGQDCDGTGTIDCDDFARIHKLGFSACGGEAIYDTDYWEKFEICYTGQPGGSNLAYNNNAAQPARSNDNNPPSYNAGGFPAFPGNTAYNGAGNVDYNYGDGVIEARDGHN